MARKKQSSKKSNKDKSNPGAAAAEAIHNGFILVDPARCRFQHSKIRPVFSGCGRDVTQVLEDIKDGKTNLQDLPPIQVLVGDSNSDDDDGSIWYFSLNNRRLWILKQLRDGGYLENQGTRVTVRVRQPKSQSERERYSVANCALNAKIMVEKPKKKKKPSAVVVAATNKSPSDDENNEIEDDEKSRNDKNEDNRGIKKKLVAIETTKISTESDGDDDDDDDDSDSDHNTDNESRKIKTTKSYFGSMIMDSSSSDDDDDDD